METKSFPSFTEKIDGDTREVIGISAVIGVVDAGNDLIHKGAFTRTLEQRAERVKHLWQHDNRQPPTATITQLREVGKGELPADMKKKYPDAKGGLLVGRKYLDTPRGNEILSALKSDPPAITEMSFGYDPVKFDFETVEAGEAGEILLRNLREIRLWDTSDVNWGMNEATVASVKAAIPYKDTGMADMGMSWSRPSLKDFTDQQWGDLGDADKRRIAAHFGWSANMPPDSFGDLKLPHHMGMMDGVGKAVWAGVRAAMSRLMQAGTDIPDADRKAVYNHLAKHYAQFEKDPPDFKSVELAWSLNDALQKAQAAEAHDLIQKLQELHVGLRLDPLPEEGATLTLRLNQEQLLRQKERVKRSIPTH